MSQFIASETRDVTIVGGSRERRQAPQPLVTAEYAVAYTCDASLQMEILPCVYK